MIRRLPVLLTLLLLPGFMAFAVDQVFLEPVIPTSPSIKAQGGASTANATGFDALFINPASYATNQTSLTFLAFESTANVPLTTLTTILEQRNNWSQLASITSANNPLTSIVTDLLTKTGVGGEASLSSGWVGNNLGAGLSLQSRAWAKGRTLLGADATVEGTVQGVVGGAWPVDIGLGTLRIGGALRPLQKTYSKVTVSDVLTNMGNVSAYTVLSGFGLGLDMGARWDFAGFKTGLAVRDMGSTIINFKSYTGNQWASSFGFPSGGSSTSSLYRIPTVVAVGTSWTPDMGVFASLVQPIASVDFQIPIKDEYTQTSFWTWTHVGAEARFLSFLAVRAGVNQGYFTFGLGAKAPLIDLNLAIYSDELGRYSGLNKRSAIAVEGAFRI